MTESLRSESIARLEAYIEHVMTQGEAAGLAIAVVDSGGQTLYQCAFGHRDRDQGLPVDGDTLFGLASVTKSFTALAIMQLCEKGMLKLHDPVCLHMPEFAHPGVTVEHLLCHNTGLYPQSCKEITQLMAEIGRPEGDPAYDAEICREAAHGLVETLNRVRDFFGPPGEYFCYSNDCYNLAAALICRVAGFASFAHYTDANILAPLGMSRSGCGFEWQGGNISRLYDYRNGVLRGDWSFYDDASPLLGAGIMKSTLNDMKRYVGMYLNWGRGPQGARLLSGAGIRQMIRPRMPCELNQYYGLGLTVKPLADLTVIEHGGNMPGISSRIALSHESGIGVIILCNTTKVRVSAISDLAMLLFSGRGALPYPPPAPAPVVWDRGLMEQVCGLYRGEDCSTFRIALDGDCFSVNLDGADTTACPVNSYMLAVRTSVLDTPVSILRDDNDRVWALGHDFHIIPKVE